MVMSDFNPSINFSSHLPEIPKQPDSAKPPARTKAIMSNKSGKTHFVTSISGACKQAKIEFTAGAFFAAHKLTTGNTSKLFKAKAIHANYKLGNRIVVAKRIFGDAVIGESRNIARKEVLVPRLLPKLAVHVFYFGSAA